MDLRLLFQSRTGVYDQSVERYGFNGTLEQWQSKYGCEGCSIENTQEFWSAGDNGAFNMYVARQDKAESDRIAVEKMMMFSLWYSMIGEVTGPSGGGGPINGAIYKGPNPRSFSYNKLYNHLSAQLEKRGISYGQYMDAIDNPLLVKPVNLIN